MVDLPDDDEIIEQFNRDLESLDGTGYQDWINFEVRQTYRMVAGDQWNHDEKKILNDENRPALVLNYMQPLINKVNGFMSMRSGDARYFPVESQGDAEYAEFANKYKRWADNVGDLQKSQEAARKDCLTTGVGVVEEFVDYDDNPDGIIKYRRIFPGNFAWDQNIRGGPIKNSRWIIAFKFMKLEDIEEEWGKDAADQIESSGEVAPRTHSTQTFREQLEENMLGLEINLRRDAFVVYDYQWFKRIDYHRVNNPMNDEDFPLQRVQIDPFTGQPIVDPTTGQPVFSQEFQSLQAGVTELDLDPFRPLWNVDNAQFQRVKDLFDSFGVELESSKDKRKQYFRAFISADVVLQKNIGPINTGFTYKAMKGFYDERRHMFYAMGRSIKDPQRIINSSYLMLYQLTKQAPNSGYFIPRAAIGDINEFEDGALQNDKNVIVEDTAGILPKQQPPPVNGFERPLGISVNSMPELIGVSDEFVSIGTENIAAALGAQRLEQSITALDEYMDSYKCLQKEQALSLLEWLRQLAENVDNRSILIDRENGADFEELNSDPLNSRYDVEIEDSPLMPHEKQMTFETMSALLNNSNLPPLAQSVMMNIALQNAPNLKQDDLAQVQQALVQASQPDPQQQQLAVANAQLDIEAKQVNNRLVNELVNKTRSEAFENLADAKNKEASADQKIVETTLTVRDSDVTPQKIADIRQQIADIELKQAQTNKANADAAKTTTDTVTNGISAVNDLFNNGAVNGT